MHRPASFFRTLLHFALPIVIQYILMSLLNLVDVLMIGQIGEIEVAAVGLANQVVFVCQLLIYGICSGAAIFTAQFWGKKDMESIHRVVGLCLLLSVAAASIFTTAAFAAPQAVLRLYTPDPEVIRIGADYLRTVVPTFLALAITAAFSLNLRSVGNPKLPMAVSVTAFSIKTLLGYLLIFGKLGFPALGVQGAALSTLIARLLESTGLLALVYLRRTPLAAHPRQFFKFNWEFTLCYLKTAFPLIINEGLWALGIAAYSAIYARISTESLAAVNILLTIEQLAFVIFAGVGSATGIIVGNMIGEKRTKDAYSFTKRALLLNLLGSLLLGAVIYTAADSIAGLYNVSAAARDYARTLIRIFGFVLWVRACYIVVLVGAIRGGGDTRYGMIVDLLTLWGVGIPMALIGAFVLHLPVYGVYLMIAAEELTKLGLLLARFFSKKWINDLTDTVPHEPAPCS